MNWQSVHVYYYDIDNQDSVILDGVRPLFADIHARVPEAYFVRHWIRGPHLRLNFHTDHESFVTVVRPAIEEIVGGHLRAHPSTVDLDAAGQLPLHRRLAGLEAEPGPLLPWHPDNTIQPADHDRRLPVLGSQEMADLLADFYVGTTDLGFQALDRVRRREESRLGVAFDLMIATCHVFYRGGITNGFLSFRSHAEVFLHSWLGGGALRPVWDRHYSRQADTLVQRVRAIVAALDREQSATPFAGWVDAVTPIAQRGLELMKVRRRTEDQDRWGRLAELSPFHRVLESGTQWHERRDSDWFAGFRMVLNFLYLHLTRLGVTPTERFLLCHLAANTVENAYGVSALELARA